jgi:DNA-binding XRE family transcriptional regulator
MQLICTKKNKLEKEIQEPSTNFALKVAKAPHCKVEDLFKLP